MARRPEQITIGTRTVNADELPKIKTPNSHLRALHSAIAGPNSHPASLAVYTSRHTQSRTVRAMQAAGLIDDRYEVTRLGVTVWLAWYAPTLGEWPNIDRYLTRAMTNLAERATWANAMLAPLPADVRAEAIRRMNGGAYPESAVQQAQLAVWERRHGLDPERARLSFAASADAIAADEQAAYDDETRRRGYTPISEIAVDDVVTITPHGARQFDVVAVSHDGMLRVYPRDGIEQGDRWPGWVGGTYVRKVPADQVEARPDDDEIDDPWAGLPEAQPEPHPDTVTGDAAGWVAESAAAGGRDAEGDALRYALDTDKRVAARAAARAGKAYHLSLREVAAARAAGDTERAAAIAEALPGLRESAVELGVDVATIEAEAAGDELRGTHADHMRHVADELRELAGDPRNRSVVMVQPSDLRRLADELAPPHTECKAAALARRAIAVQHATLTALIDLARPERPVPPATLRALVMAAAQAIAEPEPHVDQLVEHIKTRAGAAIVAETGTDPADVDALVDRLLSEGWTWAAEPEFVLGKRLRYLAPPAAADAGVITPDDEPLPAGAPRHQPPAGAPFRSCTLHGADCRAAQNGRPCSGMPDPERDARHLPLVTEVDDVTGASVRSWAGVGAVDLDLARAAGVAASAPAEAEPADQAAPASGNLVDVRPGDVWRDVTLRVTWHAREDTHGGVELYEPNGPGRVPAHMLSHNRGGWLLLGRDWPAGAEPFDGGDGPIPGYVVGDCGHRVALSEYRAGFRVCEQGCKPWAVGDRARHPRWSDLLFVVTAVDDDESGRFASIVAQNVTGRVRPYELIRVPEPQPLTDDELREWLRLRCAPGDVEFWVGELRGKTLDECEQAHEALHGDMA